MWTDAIFLLEDFTANFSQFYLILELIYYTHSLYIILWITYTTIIVLNYWIELDSVEFQDFKVCLE